MNGKVKLVKIQKKNIIFFWGGEGGGRAEGQRGVLSGVGVGDGE